jgi:hypothetical protein
VDNYVSSSALFDNIFTEKINCCGTVCHKRKGMAHDFGHKLLQVKWSDRPDSGRIDCMGKEQQQTLADMYQPPLERTLRMNVTAPLTSIEC